MASTCALSNLALRYTILRYAVLILRIENDACEPWHMIVLCAAKPAAAAPLSQAARHLGLLPRRIKTISMATGSATGGAAEASTSFAATAGGGCSSAVLWFRKGLRLHDNPALLEAARDVQHLYAVFVIDPAILRPEK